MSHTSSKAQPASFEECDDDSGKVLPDSKVEARSKPQSSTQPRQTSNIPSHTPRYTRTSSKPPTQSSTPSTSSQPRAKPILHDPNQRSSAQQSMPPPLSRTKSTSSRKSSLDCGDPQCRGRCQPTQHRTTAPQQPAPLQVRTQNLPSARVVRPRSTSMSQARPISWAGQPVQYEQEYFQPRPVMTPVNHGPPPSNSAYFRPPYQHNYPVTSQYPMTGQSYVYDTGIVSPAISSPSPIDLMPPSSRRANLNYSTRDPIVAAPMVSPTSPSARFPLARTSSLSSNRQLDMQERHRHREPLYYVESEPGREEYYQEIMPPPLRPYPRTSLTTPNMTSSSPYQISSRAPISDSGIDFLTEEYADLTLRPSISRGYSSAESSRSRRPSISTNASSARTKATTASAGSIVVEGPNGRRRFYPSDREYETIRRRMEREQKLEEARAYQEAVGGIAEELTAANIRRSSVHIPDAARSRASGHTRQSNSRDGIKIVYAGQSIEVQPANEHSSAQIIIDGISETRYAPSSHSSSSRVGRRLDRR